MAPMAPVIPLEFDLAKCFKGEQQLVTWPIALSALCDPATASKSGPLRVFLAAKESVDVLSAPWKPFPDPSPEEKQKFEAKTAPINITPAQTEHYNVNEIKEDALWLSQQARISEYAALRLAVQEWQARPTMQLLSGLTEEELLSVQAAAGISNLGASTFGPNSSILAAPSLALQPGTQFESLEQRRLRILHIYHSTRVAILRVSQLLLAWGSAKDLRADPMYDPNYRVCDDWLEQLGQAIAAQQNRKQPQVTPSGALDHCIRAVLARLDAYDNGYTWTVPESIQEAAAEKWVTGQTTEIVHLLHLAVLHADLSTTLPPAATVENWFESMTDRAYLTNFPILSPNQSPLVELLLLFTSLLSLAILDVERVIDDLDTGRYDSWDPSTYALNSGTIKKVTESFVYARQLGPSPATPPSFAWAIITYRLFMEASALEQDRSRLLDTPGSRSSVPDLMPLEEVGLALNNIEISEGPDRKLPFEDLGQACIELGVVGIINQLVDLGVHSYGTPIDRISRDKFRLVFLRLLRAALSSGIADYSSELVLAVYTILSGGNTYRNWTHGNSSPHADPVVALFLKDEKVFRPRLLKEAQFRYPYELTPFLKLSSAITRGGATHDGIPTIMNDTLTRMTTLMQSLPAGFKQFSSIREEENANFVALAVDLPQFGTPTASAFLGQRRLLTSATHQRAEDSMTIPAATEGNIVDDSKQPFVAVWEYHHSALDYLNRLLSTYTSGSKQVEHATGRPALLDDVTEIVGLLSDILHSSLQASNAPDEQVICSPELLDAMGIGAGHDLDPVNIVLAIFEEELLRLSQDPLNEGSLELVVNCTHFVQAMIVITPNRIWPWLTRSRLLESDGNGGSLASILIGTEMVLGRYDFLIGCVQMFDALVKDAVERSVARQAPTAAVSRYRDARTYVSGTSDKIISSTLLTFGRTLASVYESSLKWKYNRIQDRLEINIGICKVFKSILAFAYGVDDSPILSSKLTGLVAPIAEYITELYLTKSANDLPTNPILMSLMSGAELGETSISNSAATLWKEQTHTTLLFSDILVRVAILLNKPWTHLEQQLFKATPLLARLYATNDVWKSPVVRLLEALVRGAVREIEEPDSGKQDGLGNSKNEQEPPSLLGHLGRRTATNFLSVLSQLDEPLKIVDIQTNVWSLLSAVVTCKQQWFALYLLTGSTPRERMRNKSTVTTPGSSRNKALLAQALDALSYLVLENPNCPWPLFVAMLEFVTSAQNNWSWAMGDLRQHSQFIQQLLDFLKWMGDGSKAPKTDAATLTRSYQNRFASLACEVLAMYLHTSRQTGDVSPLKDIVPSLTYLEENVLKLPSYNVSLHSNLKQNIESKFQGVSLEKIKRTTLYPESFGKAFFYDTELANRLLRHDRHWSNQQGYLADVEKANLNLGLVDSQVQLLHSWKLLAMELGQVVSKHDLLPTKIIRTVEECMKANAESTLPEALFGQLMTFRADLAFTLLKNLVNAKVNTPKARELLSPIWQAIRSSTEDFDTIFSSDQVHYYRTLLKILYLSLQFHIFAESENAENMSFRSSFRGSVPASGKTKVTPISSQLLEILSDTVARGFRSLATQLHAEPESISPSDFALLTALLQKIIAIPEMSKWQAQAALIFANSSTIRYATSLFSWSDRLTLETNGSKDPVYGELSLLFILSLSSMESLAETMAVEGILSQLNTANLMNYYRRVGGMSPFDSPPRLFSIWSKGILPLCLNLLYSVGAPIGGEIASFLNQFSEQLNRASNALNSRTPNKITLSIASETHSLALISSILDSFRASGPRLGIQASDIPTLDWDKDNVKEDIEGWMARKGALRERIVVLDESDAVLFAKKRNGDGPDNELEQRVLMELEAAGSCLGLGQ
ncbi:nucleoporin subcomplex protein binding to Pom34-domain-containing protein [Massariosphaeria phaeospora]|uniref:Nucleoporin subcomplex protein binding to Pom34-domain-containing protein n=1 Tax=Massariosphaeria phaeospora TaxID=100035 RepID=A0A7C8I5X0_9PLEO|nr:nucleoporin subcomplex protein binding to Pom34-domain-containing protein [Massariosphaeria phaeospora]